MFEIPLTFDASKALTNDEWQKIVSRDQVFFSPKLDERIEVTHWYRYPSYDFIFGIPQGKRAEKECACMWLRHSGGKQFCIYMDANELADAAKAFTDLDMIETNKR